MCAAYKAGEQSTSLHTVSHEGELPLLPLKDLVVFPASILPIMVGRERSVGAILDVDPKKKLLFVSCQKQHEEENPSRDGIFSTGTVCRVLQSMHLKDGTFKLLVEGVERGIICDYNDIGTHIRVSYQLRPTLAYGEPSEYEAYGRMVREQFDRYVELNPKLTKEVVSSVHTVTDTGRLCDMIASLLTVNSTEKQRILELSTLKNRIEYLYQLIEKEIELLNIEKGLKEKVRQQMEKTQKEYFLNEQLKAISSELGKSRGMMSDTEEIRSKLEALQLPRDVLQKALKEVSRLEQMPSTSPEVTVLRNYLDWVLSLPWSEKSKDTTDFRRAEVILNENHAGLTEVKERILEYLAVCRLSQKIRGPVLCLSGPPGVGKTSLGQSIATALGRKFVRISLGGVRDEAEIKGHRRTYVGSMPGKILQGMKKAGVKNPVMLLDEVDKMSSDFRGDPSSALLEVLDPEQNHSFNDHYLELDYDLSEVMFICTANIVHAIPKPLRDRMEVLSIAGYSDDEKCEIAKNFLVKKLREENGLKAKQVQISDSALMEIIRHYTREAGLRNLSREISKIYRKVARKVVEKEKGTFRIHAKNISDYLGKPKFRRRTKAHASEVGVSMGLAWTEAGGEILTTEVCLLEGKGRVTLTGKLGDVMKESAQTALSCIRSRWKELHLKKDFHETLDVHVHVPEGAIPKDGPSAGITIATALASALTKKPVDKDIAMTGEITLRGNILAIGGLKEKALAAYAAGMTTVIIPEENVKDLDDMHEDVRNNLHFCPVSTIDEVFEIAIPSLQKKSSASKKRSRKG